MGDPVVPQKSIRGSFIFVLAYLIIAFCIVGCKNYGSCTDCRPFLINGPCDIVASPLNGFIWASQFESMESGSYMAITAIDTQNNNNIIVNERYNSLYAYNPIIFAQSLFFQTLGVSLTDGAIWTEGLTFSNNGATPFITRYTKDGIKLTTFPINHFGQLAVSPSTGYGWVAETLTSSANLVAYDLSGSTVTHVTLPYPVYGIGISTDSTVLVAMNFSGLTNCAYNDALIAVSQTEGVQGLYNLNYKVNAGFSITSDGSIWLGDACNNKIIKLNPDLSTNTEIDLPFMPVMFTVLSDKQEVVVVHDNTQISILNKNGTKTNSVDLANHQINHITSISHTPVSDYILIGASYMSNSNGKSLFELDANGKIIASYVFSNL